jgi:hypothetical protein
MGSDFRRIMAKRLRMKDEDLANIRQWYYSQPADRRIQFKRDLRALVEASRPFKQPTFTVEVNFQMTWYAQEPDSDPVTLTARRSPVEILHAIEAWDAADEHTVMWW